MVVSLQLPDQDSRARPSMPLMRLSAFGSLAWTFFASNDLTTEDGLSYCNALTTTQAKFQESEWIIYAWSCCLFHGMIAKMGSGTREPGGHRGARAPDHAVSRQRYDGPRLARFRPG